LREGRYQQSVAAFQGFLRDYPQSSLAANAQYWLGEAKYVSRDFEGALAEFGKVINDYPQSNKLPDAQLKLGFAQYELGQFDRARETLEQVARDHGGSAVARLAEQRLQRMQGRGEVGGDEGRIRPPVSAGRPSGRLRRFRQGCRWLKPDPQPP
jgi:tol-pal system protein YbgF